MIIQQISRRGALNWMAALSGMGAVLAGTQCSHSEEKGTQTAQTGTEEEGWQPIENDIFPPGLKMKPLFENKEGKYSFALVRYPAGYREPRHYHKTCGHVIYFLKGKFRDSEKEYPPGTLAYAPPDEPHGPFFTDTEVKILFFVDGTFDLYAAPEEEA
jgi:quercetin dioxygenase-like cupin family protein